jgi:NADH-quinone oxidoreductase subunit L
VGRSFWRAGDQTLIDGLMVNGSARLTGWFSGVVSLLQSGMIYRYASVMLMGVVILAFWFLKN